MLSQRVKELLAAAVDGDVALDDRQKRSVQRLLNDSAEARQFLDKLKRDSRRLKKMPRAQLPATFSADVLRNIGPNSKPTPATVAATAQRYLPMWANLVAALSVLVAVSIGTYLIVTITDQQQAARQAAEKRNHPPAPNPTTPGPGDTVARNEIVPDPSIPDVLPAPRPADDDIASAPMPELPDAPEPENKAVLTIPFNPKLELFKVELPKLPPILPVRELDQAIHRATILESLRGDDGFHLDLFCKDANRGFERVQAALRGQGRKVIVEALAQTPQAKVKTNYVFYCETMSADDVAKLLGALAAEERKGDAKQMEKLVVTPMSPVSHKTLAALLGIDPKLLNLKAKPVVHDPTKPISDSTAEALAKALADKERAGGGAKPPESTVLAMSFNPIRPNPALSKEVREFLTGRKERKVGAPAFMIVVRNLD